MIRGIVTSVIEGLIKLFSATGRPDALGGSETFDQREYFQHYGFTSRPKPGAELIIIREGNHIIAVASDDRRYRLAMAEGEMAIYDWLGQHVHLKADGTIQVVGINEIHATAPLLTVTASSKVTLDTPTVEATGNILAHGDITDHSTGTGRSMQGMRQIFDGHNHNDPQGGAVAIPNQQM